MTTRSLHWSVRRIAPLWLLLGLSSPALHAADVADLYERYDRLVVQSQSIPPAHDPADREGGVPVYFSSPHHAADHPLWIAVHDQSGALLARLEVQPHAIRGHQLRPAGRVDAALLEQAGELTWSVEGEQVKASAVFDLGAQLRMLHLSLSGDAGGPWKIEADVWAPPAEGGIVLGLRRLFRFGGDNVTRYLPLDLAQRPDLRHALGQCRSEPGWDGHDALRRLQGEAGVVERPAYWELLARCALDLGARELALEYVQRWFQTGGGDIAIRRAAVSFARLDLNRDDAHRARGILSTIEAPESLGSRYEAAWRDLFARILLQEGDFAAAAAVLEEGPHLRLFELWEGDSRILRSFDFMRINQAVALLGAGRIDDGRALLDMVGSRHASETLAIRLRDRVNVMLGWSLLRDGHGPEAAAVFDRVALDGPYATAALLGRGWASIVGDNGYVERAEVPGLSRDGLAIQPVLALYQAGDMSCFEARQALKQPVSGCTGSRRFARAALRKDSTEAMQSALRYWSRLQTADLRSVEAAEGIVAAADAHDLLGDRARAQQLLSGSIARLDAASGRLSAASAYLASRDAIDGYARLLAGGSSAGGASEDLAYFLRDWASRNESAELQATRGRALALAAHLQDTAGDAAAAASLAAELRRLAGEVEDHMRMQMQEALQLAAEEIDRYRSATLLKLARLQERRLQASP